MKKIIIPIITFTFLASCSTSRIGEQKSLGLNVTNTITADIETTPTPQHKEDDSADDPAIWVNSANVQESLIFGTDKKGGIASYKLTNGEEVSYDKVGKINNIDIRQNIVVNGENVSILAGSDRAKEDIIFGTIDNNGKLTYHPLSGTEKLRGKEVYGFCLGLVDGKPLAFINDKDGYIYIFELIKNGTEWSAKSIKTLKVDTQPEGMVVDDANAKLYVGQEEYAVWNIDLNDYSYRKINKSSEYNNEFIKYDIEGISLYPTGRTTGYLIVSSQGNNSYALFKREGNNDYITSFRIVDGTIDGVEETDGLDVVNANLGSQFPKGILVTQDGFNYDGEKKKSQNFKIIDWQKVERLIK